MGHLYGHLQGHITGALRPGLLPTGSGAAVGKAAEYDPPTTDLVLWLNPNDASTIDSPVGLTTAIDDKSGAGNHATTRTGRPLSLHSNPMVQARRIVRAEGASGATGGYFDVDGLVSTINADAFTLIWVGSATKAGTPARTIFGAGSTLAANPVIWVHTEAATNKWRLFLRNAAGTTVNDASTSDSDQDMHVWTLRLDGTTAVLRVDGAVECSVAWTGTNSVNTASFGALRRAAVQDCCDLLMGTVLCYSSALSDVDVAAIEDALMAQETAAPAGLCAVPTGLTGRLGKLVYPTANSGAYSAGYSSMFHGVSASIPGVYYVDPINGNNAAAGTSGAPLKDANTALAKSDVNAVILAAGIYTQDEPWTTYVKPERSVAIGCLSGRAVIGKFETPTWTLATSQTYTYQHTLAGTLLGVYDATVRDSDGLPTPLTSRASVALVEANPGSYYNNAGTLYVHSVNSRVADRSIIVCLTGATAPTFPFSGPAFFASVKGVDFVGTTPGAGVAFCNYYFDDVRTQAAPESLIDTGFELYRYQCVSANAQSDDVWDYKLAITAAEILCTVRNPGNADSDNCSTAHGTATVVRISGTYEGGARVVHDIEASMSWNLGCSATNAYTGGANTDHGFTNGDIGIASTALMWLDGCAASGNAVDIYTGNGATTRYKNMTIGDFTTTTEVGGTLTTY